MKNIFTLVLLYALLSKNFAQECPPNDPTFGINGKAVSGSWAYDTRTIVQPDGKIIQVGKTFSGPVDAIVINKLNINGSPDLSFGTSGRVVLLSSNSSEDFSVADIGLQPDGKIIVAGMKLNYDSDIFKIVLFRFNMNGSADLNFGNNGEKIIDINATWANVESITLQPGGKIILSGTSYSQTNLCQVDAWSYPNVFITRINENGSLDSSWGTNGKIIFNSTNYYDNNLDVSVQSNGKILLASLQGYQCSCQPGYYGGLEWICNKYLLLLRRLNTDGTRDNTFGVNGIIIDSSIIGYDVRMEVLPDDKIIIASSNNSFDFLVNQYTPEGAPDIGFGRGGKAITRVIKAGYLYSYFYDIHIQPDGKILLLGKISDNFNEMKSILVRCKTNGDLDSSFYTNGVAFFNFDTGHKTEHASSVVMQDNMIIVGGARSELNSRSMLVIRFLEKNIAFEPPVIANGPLTFCRGDSVRLTTTFPGNYQWYLDNINLSGATNASYKATIAGTYRLMANNSTGCGISSAFNVVVKNLPQISDINFNGTQLSTDAIYTKYQWYLNGTAISGANSSGYTPGTNLGTYKVQVTNADNCSNFSNEFTYVITGIADLILGDTKMRYYPNPAQTRLNIDIAKLSGKKISGDLFDMSGKLMVSQSFRQGHNEISLSGIPSGVYSLVIRAGNETAVRKLMIVK